MIGILSIFRSKQFFVPQQPQSLSQLSKLFWRTKSLEECAESNGGVPPPPAWRMSGSNNNYLKLPRARNLYMYQIVNTGQCRITTKSVCICRYNYFEASYHIGTRRRPELEAMAIDHSVGGMLITLLHNARPMNVRVNTLRRPYSVMFGSSTYLATSDLGPVFEITF